MMKKEISALGLIQYANRWRVLPHFRVLDVWRRDTIGAAPRDQA